MILGGFFDALGFVMGKIENFHAKFLPKKKFMS
jgi:hypothetical protein